VAKRVHAHARLDQLQLPQDWMKLVLQNIRQPQRRAVSGFKEITGSSPLQVLFEFHRYGGVNRHRNRFYGIWFGGRRQWGGTYGSYLLSAIRSSVSWCRVPLGGGSLDRMSSDLAALGSPLRFRAKSA